MVDRTEVSAGQQVRINLRDAYPSTHGIALHHFSGENDCRQDYDTAYGLMKSML